ncbi:L-proline glycine betaine ABC transport system permease protein ProW [Actinokineospora spheciospongiae]|uniref:L-proline glycine betaine ABC transport system permease protein ProW n=1 Tax=Actinokineospora spheciospongiae TaxID=909613 RepID=W7IMF1_9PSEU|nr:ABC transporter permease subunit [Actinokineospora spheciospongiae]EWC62055.1 L-proline glycine betaine ABC transport system permease protein ProW [Actinokineospora spheciospongiae]PWW64633.1 osmoprotectant transport system permease protein [Actinokineospora spheciospongiae]
MNWLLNNLDGLGPIILTHLWLALVPVVVGTLVSMPLGWASSRWPVARAILVPLSSLLYTIPSLALFVIMPLVLGTQSLEPINVQVALTLYTVALLVRSITDALSAVPESVTTAATAMGYRPIGRFFAVELPLAVPVLIAGIRVAAVSNMGLVAIGQLIGVTSLGLLLLQGSQTSPPNFDQIIVGIVIIVLLALVVDGLLALLGRRLTPWARVGPKAGAAT